MTIGAPDRTPAQGDREPAPPPKQRRHLKRITVAAAAVVIALSLIWLVFFYTPLGRAGYEIFQSGGTAQVHGVHTFSFGSEWVFEFTPNADFSYAFAIGNNGPLPIKLLDVQGFGNDQYRFLGAFVLKNEGYADLDRVIPLRNVTIGAHADRTIVLRYRFGGCDQAIQANSSSAWHKELIKYSFLGVPRTDVFTMPNGVAVVGRKGVCGQ
ncbi:MAG: hypothetical protein ABR548_12675 [Actinomycetota bacterium]|nr:hypothetical protein [Actinomycetota bacterium]